MRQLFHLVFAFLPKIVLWDLNLNLLSWKKAENYLLKNLLGPDPIFTRMDFIPHLLFSFTKFDFLANTAKSCFIEKLAKYHLFTYNNLTPVLQGTSFVRIMRFYICCKPFEAALCSRNHITELKHCWIWPLSLSPPLLPPPSLSVVLSHLLIFVAAKSLLSAYAKLSCKSTLIGVIYIRPCVRGSVSVCSA